MNFSELLCAFSTGTPQGLDKKSGGSLRKSKESIGIQKESTGNPLEFHQKSIDVHGNSKGTQGIHKKSMGNP